MLDHAREKWQYLSPPPEFLEGSMIDFEYDGHVDFVFVMLGSLYVNNAADLVRHFDAVSKLLNPGGLYFLDWCIQFSDPLQYNGRNSYSLEKNGIAIQSQFSIRLVDAPRHIYEEIWTVNINDHGQHRTLQMTERNMAMFPDEFTRFVTNRDDFEFVGWWRDWDFGQPISGNKDVHRPITLLRRTSQPTPQPRSANGFLQSCIP